MQLVLLEIASDPTPVTSIYSHIYTADTHIYTYTHAHSYTCIVFSVQLFKYLVYICTVASLPPFGILITLLAVVVVFSALVFLVVIVLAPCRFCAASVMLSST